MMLRMALSFPSHYSTREATVILPFRTKRALAWEMMNNLRVRDPDRLEAALRTAMGDKFDNFVAWLVQEGRDYYATQRDRAQEAHDAIDALPDEEPEEPQP